MSEQELIWVPKHIKEKYDEVQDKNQQDKIILDWLEQCRNDIHSHLETLDDDVLYFRGMMAKARQDFKKAKDEQLAQLGEIWEGYEVDISNLDKKINSAKERIGKLVDEVRKLKEVCEPVFGLNRELAELSRNISTVHTMLAPYSPQAKLLHFVLKEYATVKKADSVDDAEGVEG